MSDLEAVAQRLTSQGRYGLGVRVDGYWFLAFLRARGGEMFDPVTGSPRIDRPEAHEALRQFQHLFGAGGVAPPPAAPGDEAREEVARFRAGRLAMVLDGPWALRALAGGDPIDDLAVTPFPRGRDGRPAHPPAPRSGGPGRRGRRRQRRQPGGGRRAAGPPVGAGRDRRAGPPIRGHGAPDRRA
jgi:arabinogalactan oligomer/maltooligosaccharide transport system substrate-binding protein